MGWLSTISGALFGTSSSKSGGLATSGNFAIDGGTAQIGNGAGVAITPDDRETVGVFVDGGLVKAIEQNGLAVEPWMASECEAMAEKFKGYKANTKRATKAIKSISKDSVEIVRDVYSAKAEVSRNHVAQHQAHNRFLDVQDKNAGAYSYEEKRRNKEADRVQSKLQEWEAKMLSTVNAI
ncbi:MAG: hypothetical protein ACOVQ7_24170 [Limnoraphis robusta]